MTQTTEDTILTTLVRLHDAVRETTLPLEVPEVRAARAMRAQVVSQLEDYVLPRLVQIDAPLLAVVGGSTGAGKSTLVNSIVGEQVSLADVLRPTTRSPVLVHNPADGEWFQGSRILPDFERTSRTCADPGALQLVASENVPVGLAILDAPDVDSVERRNRELAAQLLDAADLWLFVTSAARYADEVPWRFLRSAAERSAAVAVVLDRTAAGAVEEVGEHLARMLSARGLHDSPLFRVPESALLDGLLPGAAVEPIQVWLEALATDQGVREGVVRRTLDGAIREAARRTHEVADACKLQDEAREHLLAAVAAAYARAAEQAALGAGPAHGRQDPGTVVESAARTAAEEVDREWRRSTAGRAVLEASPAGLSGVLEGDEARFVGLLSASQAEAGRAEILRALARQVDDLRVLGQGDW